MSERVRAGLDRARSQGKHVGRPKLVIDRQKIVDLHVQGLSNWKISQEVGISQASVGRIVGRWKAANSADFRSALGSNG